MATLNTMRTKGALFLSIFIGVALIAFLLGDLSTAGGIFQARKMRVASIDGNNIDYAEYADRLELTSNVIEARYGLSTLTAEQSRMVDAVVWNSYINRLVHEPGYRKLGLAVGEAEQVDMVSGRYLSPVLVGMFGDPATGMVNREALAGFVGSLGLDGTGRMAAMWDFTKEEMVTERTRSKFVALVLHGLFVNDLEVARGVAMANNSYSGSWAQVPFSAVADSLVEISGAEVRKYYGEHKDNFKRTASRDVEYVLFDVAPSPEDYAEAAAHIETLGAEFAASDEPMEFARVNSQDRAYEGFYREDQLDPEFAAIAFGDRQGQMFGPTLNGDTYIMARVSERRMMPDSVGARQITLPLGSPATDSIVRAVRGGGSIVELARVYSLEGDIVDLGVFSPDQMFDNIRDNLIAARVGEVFTFDSQYNTHVVEMTYKSPAVQKAQIATIAYDVVPSAETEYAVYIAASDFVSAAAGSRENFDAAVQAQGLSKRVANIGQDEREIDGLAGSHSVVNWAFNSKPGAVSQIYDIDGGDHVVAVVTEAKEAGYAPVEDVSVAIAARLRREKKTEMLSGRIAGKSIAEVGAMEGAKSGQFVDLKGNALYEASLGVEPAVIGALPYVSGVSKPVQGYAGVFLVGVDSTSGSVDVTEDSERVRLEASAETSLPERISTALDGQIEIVDNRVKFF